MATKGRPKKVEKTQVCFCCGEGKPQIKSFYSSRSPMYVHNDGRLPICKECIIKMYDSFDIKYKNTTVAIYRLCNLLDLYFDVALLNTLIRNKEDNTTQTHIAQSYVQKLVSLPQYKNLTALNNNDANLIASRVDINAKGELIDVAIEDLEREFVVTPEIIKRFGSDYAKDEYIILEEKFTNMMDTYDTSNPNAIWIYESISKNYVEAERLRKSGNYTGYLKMLESISKMMGDCKIKPSQLDNTEEETACFGMFIRNVENNRPIEAKLEEFEDVDGIRKYFEEFFVSPMKRTLDLVTSKIFDNTEEVGEDNEN